MSKTIPATPAKLRNGSWGAKTASPVASGDVVTIRTRAGKTWDARVTRIVWTDGSSWLCATESLGRPARRGDRGGRLMGWDGRVRRTSREDADMAEDMGCGLSV